jgi:hypothetical protein
MTTTVYEAQQRGRKYAVQATPVTELIIVFLLFTFLLTATKSVSFLPALIKWIGLHNFLVFILGTLLFSYLLGQKAGVGIIIKGKDYCWTGYTLGFLVVLFSTLLSSLFALIAQSLSSDLPNDWLIACIAKPLIWMIPSSVALFLF